ncbi:unnamed protein product [[Candida] boidinii]|nr:unnamed protein product [[Candida] boidinii]
MIQQTFPIMEPPEEIPDDVLDDYLKAQILALDSTAIQVRNLSNLGSRIIPKPKPLPQQVQQQQQQQVPPPQQQLKKERKKKHFKNPFHHKHKEPPPAPVSSPPIPSPAVIKDDLIFTELIDKLEKLAKTGNIPDITIKKYF